MPLRDLQIAQDSGLAISLGAVCDLLTPVHLFTSALLEAAKRFL
jgi:hypothetical protein